MINANNSSHNLNTKDTTGFRLHTLIQNQTNLEDPALCPSCIKFQAHGAIEVF
jgi:hypothetical protein